MDNVNSPFFPERLPEEERVGKVGVEVRLLGMEAFVMVSAEDPDRSLWGDANIGRGCFFFFLERDV